MCYLRERWLLFFVWGGGCGGEGVCAFSKLKSFLPKMAKNLEFTFQLTGSNVRHFEYCFVPWKYLEINTRSDSTYAKHSYGYAKYTKL